MRHFRFLFALALPMIVLACASTQRAENGGDSSRNVLTAEEISAARVPNGYDAVDRLRHAWLRDRATGAGVTVYMGSQRLQGGAEALRAIYAHEIAELQYIRGSDAVLRWGDEAKGGAIVVTRKQK